MQNFFYELSKSISEGHIANKNLLAIDYMIDMSLLTIIVYWE